MFGNDFWLGYWFGGLCGLIIMMIKYEFKLHKHSNKENKQNNEAN